MSEKSALGTPGEFNRYKVYYILFMMIVLGFLFFSYIGHPNPQTKQTIIYYILFGTILGIIPVLFDNATKKDFPLLDTVTIETPTKVKPIHQLFIAIVLTALLSARILITQTAFIPYPKLQVFDEPVPNAVLSGLFGITEQWAFFVFLFPTAYVLTMKFLKNNFVIAFVLSSLLTAIIFMSFHLFVYAARQDALVAVFVFAYFNMLPMVFFRSTIIGDSLHFGNNFVAHLSSIQKIGFAILG